MSRVDIYTTDKTYDVIYADPPWRYNDKNCNGACEQHYSTMSLSDLKKLPVDKISRDDCVLFMWITYPMIREGLELMDAWGFSYKSIGFQWIKKNKNGDGDFFGLGRWTRGNTEGCFIGTKGKPARSDNSIFQLIRHPVGRHSAKPPIVRDKIKQLLGEELDYIELFAREKVSGWDCWGDEV